MRDSATSYPYVRSCALEGVVRLPPARVSVTTLFSVSAPAPRSRRVEKCDTDARCSIVPLLPSRNRENPELFGLEYECESVAPPMVFPQPKLNVPPLGF